MKKGLLNISALIMIFLAATGCKDDAKKAKTEEAKTITEVAEEVAAEAKYKVAATESMVSWKANKVVGGHEGTINISRGIAHFKGDALVGGNFVFDIKTLKNTDIPADDEGNGKLVGHLLSPDFFDAEQFPNATFEITSVKGNNVSGNLTLKGIKKNVTFPAIVAIAGDEVSITSETFTIDRTEWDIKHNSGKFADPAKLGDYMINDNIELKIAVKAKKA